MLSPGTWAFGLLGVAFGAAVSSALAPPQTIEPQPFAVLGAPAPESVALQSPEAPRRAAAALPAASLAEAAPRQSFADDALARAVPPPAEDDVLHKGAVARIVDGDTFYLEGVRTRIRLWGVDAPEKNEPGAAEATSALAGLVAGRTLACEEKDRDRYARIVARCTLDDGRDIARILIDIGAAKELPRFSGGYYGG